jgi:hypothetical protein
MVDSHTKIVIFKAQDRFSLGFRTQLRSMLLAAAVPRISGEKLVQGCCPENMPRRFQHQGLEID